jgi:small GTP-binding protein
MKKYKVSMLGAFAVGKTSLVRQYVFSIFSGSYQTTLGVKIDKKSLEVDGETVELILWDLAGEDDFMKVPGSYLRGSSGVVLVADGTRADTLETAIGLNQKVLDEVGDIPVILLVNKSDVKSSWTIDQSELKVMQEKGWRIIETSAMDGDNVNQAYQELAQQLIARAAQ